MSILSQFDPPANQNDLPTQPDKERLLRAEWSKSVNRWTEAAILGDPWTSLNDKNRSYYFNPLVTDVPSGTTALISWIAFPNRILLNFNNSSVLEQMGFAEGRHMDGTFGPPPDVNGRPYRPGGPRGWQDEYCEWISTLNSAGKITQVDFTCENPEYWFTLWRVSPETVLSLYRELVSPDVQLEDLFLLDKKGNPVIDRATGFPAYEPVNKWNNQPSAGATTGAVHLISPPNTLGAEIYLAAAATLLRDNPPGTPVTDPDALIRCSLYGGPGRNSDPHIGATVNNVILGGQAKVTLQNPVGLYIQTPDFSTYQLPSDPNLPAGAQPSDCWHIVRGQESVAGFEGNFILHARFALPQSWIDAGVSFTVGDITIEGNPIQFGAQIAQTFQIGLRGLVLRSQDFPAQPHQPCVESTPPPTPRQLQDLNLLASTSSAVTKVEQGTTIKNIGLFASFAEPEATIEFSGNGVTVEVTTSQPRPGFGILYVLSITAAADAPLGDRSLLLTNPDGGQGPAAPGLLEVVAPGTLGQVAVPPDAVVATASAEAAEDELDLSRLDLSKLKGKTYRY